MTQKRNVPRSLYQSTIAVCMVLCFAACSSAGTSTKSEEQLLAQVTKLKSDISKTTPIQIHDWDCDITDPRFTGLDMMKRLDALGSNCVWSPNSDVIEVELVCGSGAKRQCDTILSDISRTTGVFESVDLSKMLASRMLDGLQTSQNGFTSWTVTERGIHLIIDARAFLDAEESN